MMSDEFVPLEKLLLFLLTLPFSVLPSLTPPT
jgi:hypothetical protein